MRSTCPARCGVLAVVLLAGLGGVGEAQRGRVVLRGRVIDSADAPVAGAHVSLHGTRHSTITDDSGRFVIRNVKAELHVMRLRRVGFEPALHQLELDGIAPSDSMLTFDIELKRQPQQLAIVRVEGKAFKPERLAYTTRFDDFYIRRERGIGHHFARDDLAKMQGGSVNEALRLVPGVRIAQVGWDSFPVFASCPAPHLYFDGMRVQEGVRALRDVNLNEIEGVEVYTRMSDIPPESRTGCGAIFIWFRGRG